MAPLEVPAGFKVDIEFDVLRQAADVWYDSLIKVINGIKIPDVESNGNYIKDSHFYIEQRIDEVVLTPDVANNAVQLVCEKLTAEFRTNKFRYKVAPLVVAKGHAEVDMKTVKIGFALQFKTQTTPDGRQVMMCDTVDIVVDINRNDIKLHISGNWLSQIGSIATVFFKGTVVDLINDAITTGLGDTLPSMINQQLLANDGYIPFTSDFKLDWESPTPAIVATDDWCLPIKGLFIENKVGPVLPQVAVPDMPCKVTDDPSKLQAFVSTFTIDSFMQAGLEAMPIAGWYNSTSVTTDELNTVLPGIKTKYGAGTPVYMHFNVAAMNDITV